MISIGLDCCANFRDTYHDQQLPVPEYFEIRFQFFDEAPRLYRGNHSSIVSHNLRRRLEEESTTSTDSHERDESCVDSNRDASSFVGVSVDNQGNNTTDCSARGLEIAGHADEATTLFLFRVRHGYIAHCNEDHAGTYPNSHAGKDGEALLASLIEIPKTSNVNHITDNPKATAEGGADGVEDGAAKVGRQKPDGTKCSINDLYLGRRIGLSASGTEKVQGDVEAARHTRDAADDDTT